MKIRCICDPKGDAARHPDGDEITFREKLDFHGSMTIVRNVQIAKEFDNTIGMGEILTILTEGYILYGIASWSVRDSHNKPVDPSKAEIKDRILSDPELAMSIGDAADEVFAGQVMLPLLQRALNFSPDTPTDESTSPTNGTPPKPHRKLSKRSSITTIPTADTATTSSSLDGDSSSSQSSTSAA